MSASGLMGLNNVCRTCLMETDDAQSLYESSSMEIKVCVADILMAFTPLKFHSTDGYPAIICTNCMKELLQFNAFVIKCQVSDKTLRHTPKIIQNTANTVSIGNITIIDDHIKLTTNENNIPNTNTQYHYSHGNVDLQNSLTEKEVINELGQDIDILKHEIDIKNDSEGNTTGENPGNEYLCPICEQSFRFEDFVTAHRDSHETRPYACPECEWTFVTHTNLATHMRVHTKEKLYACTVCNRTFATHNNVKVHLRTHTGEKPFTCTICNSSFTIKKQMDVHMHVHAQEKPFECSVCNRGFLRKDALTMHFRTHTGVKPHKCTICECEYTAKRTLVDHMRIHTGEKPFECVPCKRAFRKKYHLTLHLRKEHRSTHLSTQETFNEHPQETSMSVKAPTPIIEPL